ncbi:transmembrane protein 91-like [Lissotriton helveticus]
MEESTTSQHPPAYSHSSPAMASSQPPPYANVVTVLPATMQTTIQTTTVTTDLPVYVPDYMRLSTMSILLCFLPVGIAALVFSCKTRSCNLRGDVAGAQENSKTALNLNLISICIGILTTIAWVIYLIYFLATRTSSSSSYYIPYYYG